MTDLQMGLIGLGGIAVVGVLAYNKWQEHKHHKLAEKVLNARQPDAALEGSTPTASPSDTADDDESLRVEGESLSRPAGVMPGERQEPLLRIEPDLLHTSPNPPPLSEDRFDRAPRTASSAVGTIPTVEADGSEATTPSGQAELSRGVESGVPLCVLSPMIDYIAAIEVSQPVGAYRLRELPRAALRRIGKAVNWIAYNEDVCEWEPLADDSDRLYRHLRVGLQLVDRNGPVSDGDLSIFHVAMQNLAAELTGVVDLPLREPALVAAAELDQFCAGVDIQIGINVISQGQVFLGTKLRALAESAGMTIDIDGRFVRCDDDGNVLFVLVNQEASSFAAESIRALNTHGITFLLDVPRVANGDRVLMQMLEQARRCADALRGALVDDNRRPLSESAIEPIRRQVAQYQAAMAQRQLPAGGRLALRLFS